MQDKCQVFTPDNIVNKLLDEASYRNDLFGKKFMRIPVAPATFLSEL